MGEADEKGYSASKEVKSNEPQTHSFFYVKEFKLLSLTM